MPSKGNPHLRIRVDPVVKRFLRGYATAHDTTTAGLVREVLAEWVRERVDPTPSKRVDHTLHALDFLAKRLELKVARLPADLDSHGSELGIRVAGNVKVAGGVIKQDAREEAPRIDSEKERESMYRIVVGMLKEAQRLSEDEELAKKAEARMGAMMVASNLTRVGEAVLAGYERGYLQPLVDELVQLIEHLKEQLEQAHQARQESAPTGTTT